MIRARRDPGLSARLTGDRELDGVRAGSALLRVGERLLVVGDDAHAATWVYLATGATTAYPLVGDGGVLAKLRKPDFEAAARASDGSAWIFGSGSLSNRWQLVRLSGADLACVTAYDASAMYAALGDVLGGPPNIEGALFDGDVLRLAHRATGEQPDVLVDLAAHGLVTGRPRVLATTRLEPAVVAGVPAHLTDLAVVRPGLTAYLAAAEDTADAVADGPVAGTLLGLLSDQEARWTPLLEADGEPSVRKAEGLVLDADRRGGWLVTDRDDPDLPAQLCRLELDLDPR